MQLKPLTSASNEVESLEEAVDLYYRRGWTDGLPVIPPTEDRVRRFLQVAGRQPDEVLGFYTSRRRYVTAEKVAINAVMAGCLPEYFPVVLAIVETMLEPDFGLHGANSSTSNPAIGFIVNGPIRNTLGMNYRGNMLGPGNRANSTIGRAVRLTQINVMGSVPLGAEGDHARPAVDRATFGQPGKYACFHIVENEEDFPSLLPLHVERGFSRQDNVVTVFSSFGGHGQISTNVENTADTIASTIAHFLVGTGRFVTQGHCVLLVPPEIAEYIVKDGWSKADLRKAIFERTKRTVAWVKQQGSVAVGGMIAGRGGVVQPGDEEKILAIAGSPEDILIVIGGGPAGAFNPYLFAGAVSSRKIRV